MLPSQLFEGARKKQFIAPFTLHATMMKRIRQETDHARQKEPARIVAKIADNRQAWVLDADGGYALPDSPKGAELRDSQAKFLAVALGASKPRRKARAQKDAMPKLQVAHSPK